MPVTVVSEKKNGTYTASQQISQKRFLSEDPERVPHKRLSSHFPKLARYDGLVCR